ncbi:DUF547 domain-containing protein [Flavobacteriales bacterium]|nr:DUF547 domain-containing protein [Flavobacteriales bacterium]
MNAIRAVCFSFCLAVNLHSYAQAPASDSNCTPPNHSPWSELLVAYVDSTGWVNYKGFVQDSVKLNAYLTNLSKCTPSAKWKEEEKLAYWINVYNAFTVKLIVEHYPVASIKDIKKGIPFINSVWEMDFFKIGGEDYNLSNVEHDILRKGFNEPRIHFAIVCGSKSCPRLLNEAYEAEKLGYQLMIQTRNFMDDNSKNEIEVEEIRISSIFKWFEKDFTQGFTIQEFIRPYSKRDFLSSAKVKYLSYDWDLNGE